MSSKQKTVGVKLEKAVFKNTVKKAKKPSPMRKITKKKLTAKIPTATSDGKYQMWISFNAEKQKIRLPVHPENIQIKNGGMNTSVNVAGLGEITIKQDRKAFVYSFSSFFPAQKFPGIKVEKLKSPQKLVKKINTWKEKKKPVHFVITNGGVDVYCTIENFTYKEVGGDQGTYQYEIELKEYREVKVRKIKKKKKKKGKKQGVELKKAVLSRTDSRVAPDLYVVKKGDSLWNISRRFYGDGALYSKIYSANKGTIGGNPNMLSAGLTLKLPD